MWSARTSEAAPRQPAADVQQAGVVGRADVLGAGLAHGGKLVVEHRRRGVGVLDGERPAEAAALLAVGQVDQLEPADVLQEPQRRVADPERAQRVAGRVVGDAVWERRADVVDAELVGDELGELEHAPRDRAQRGRAGAGRLLLSQQRVLLADHRGARARRRDDRVVGGAVEHLQEALHQRQSLAPVARVRVQLPAARLFERERDLVPEPLQQRHGRATRLREERVVHARDEQGDAHTRGEPTTVQGFLDRRVAADQLESRPDQRVVAQDRVQDGGDVGARDLATRDRRADRHGPGRVVVRQPAGADDRVVESALHQRLVRVVLGLEVDAEAALGAGRLGIARAHRADHHVALDALDLAGLDQLDRAAEVHRQLAGLAAAWSGTGGEDHGLHALDRDRDVTGGRLLEIDHRGLRHRPSEGRPRAPRYE